MINKKYYIQLKSSYRGLWYLNEELRSSSIDEFKQLIKQYGIETEELLRYKVVDEQLFALFLLEYSDRIVIEEYLGQSNFHE